MSDFVNTIDLLGDEVVANSLIDKSITEFNDNVLTSFRRYAFIGCTALTSVDLPLVTSIPESAFANCAALTSVNLPLLTSIGDYAFDSCKGIKSISFPRVTTVGRCAFKMCSLASADFPSAESIGERAFEYCRGLTSVKFPLVTGIDTRAFRGCYELTSVDFPLVTQIPNQAFESCTVFKTLILRNSTLCTLSNTNAFTGTPFASGGTGGTLIAPSSLVEGYKTATNWSVIWGYGHNRFLALEDYTVDGTITGEIDWEKLNGGTTT